jgi:hypothetical protein
MPRSPKAFVTIGSLVLAGCAAPAQSPALPLPEAVRATVDAVFPAARVVSYDRESRVVVVYEVDLLVDDGEFLEAIVSEDGVVVATERLANRTGAVPVAVRRAARSLAPHERVGVDRVEHLAEPTFAPTLSPRISYELEWIDEDGIEREAKVCERGLAVSP